MSGTLLLGCVYGAGNGAFLAVDYALAVDTLPDKKAAAKDLGLWGIAAFIGAAIGPAILGPLLHIVGLLSVGAPVWPPSSEVERYGVPGFVAILLTGSAWCGVAVYLLLSKVKTR